MAPDDPGLDPDTRDRLAKAAAGDNAAWPRCFGRHRDRLRRMVALRLDRRLQGRVDPSDVLQEAYLDASPAARPTTCSEPDDAVLPLAAVRRRPASSWPLHRHHLGAQVRDAGREVSLYRGRDARGHLRRRWPPSCSGRYAGPSEAAVRAELKLRLQEALNGMDPIDREVLALRHFEQLTNAETAQVLGIERGGRRQAVRAGPGAAARTILARHARGACEL